jgi:hypothetical protein
MAQLSIKSCKPYVETKANKLGSKEFIKVGIAVYKESERDEIRDKYLSEFSTTLLTRWGYELEELAKDTSISEDELEQRTEALERKISLRTKEFGDTKDDFCRKHIAYLKGVSLDLEEDGKVTELLINDTREAKPVDGLWDTPEECLVVLLDIFLDSVYYRSSLHDVVRDAVFTSDFKGLEAKNS